MKRRPSKSENRRQGGSFWRIVLIDPSILHKTSANTNFSNLVLAQNGNLERQKPSKSAIFGVLRDFKCC